MASKPRSLYRCTDCGADFPKWAGRCDGCGAWNTLVEELVQRRSARTMASSSTGAVAAVKLGDLSPQPIERIPTLVGELDFVLGGGIVPGSLTLVGGEPGIGKSTLLLQVAGRVQAGGVPTMYASGEESVDQVRLRADRLEEDTHGVMVLPEVRLESILERTAAANARVLIVDSIQTTYTDALEGAPGNVGQVRECAARLMRFAKETGTAVFLVGHVTRGGGIAGPKTLEHIVDTVLYFEGDATNEFRVLRAVKNRFGSVDEVGIFEMTSLGLQAVSNPSAAFLSGRHEGVPGAAVTSLMEGSRPVLVEIQALAAKAGFGTPQRVATGLDHKRLSVLLAVLERRAQLPFHDLDVFLNVTGGVRLVEPASDLAIVAALLSSLTDRATPMDAVFVGEIGLGGEIRPIRGSERRLLEAERQGFRTAFVSERGKFSSQLNIVRVGHVSELAAKIAA